MKQLDLDRIHSYKLATPNKVYTNERGEQYIGTSEGRLKRYTPTPQNEVSTITNVTEINNLDSPHASTHEDGGTDEIDVTDLSGELADPQKVTIHKNGTSVGTRPNINLIEGSGITLTILDDAPDDEVDVTIASATPLFSKSTVDQSSASTSLFNITNLALSIASSQTIYFKCLIHVGTSANNGVRYAVTIPTGATMKVMLTGQTTTAIASGASGNATQWLTTSGTQSGTINGIIQANQNAVLEGWVVNSTTAGTIQIQGKSQDAANTVTFYAGSFITGHVI